MPEISWIKLSTTIFDNRKIKQLRALPEGDSLLVIWLQLLCLAGTTNDGGRIYLTNEIPYTETMLATAFGEPLATVQLALKTFSAFNMLEIVDDLIMISNWEKYQAIEGMEKVREQNRIRKQNQRERERLLIEDSHVTVTEVSRDVTEQNKNKSKKENKNNRTTRERFTPPTLEELNKYCWEKGYTFSVEKFISYYESNGWKVGKNPMRSWKATADRWAMDEKPKRQGYNSDNVKEEPKKRERSYSQDEFERLLGISEE